MNNYDALLREINLVSDQKEQETIAKAFENAEFIENIINNKPSASLNKALADLDNLSRKSAKQARIINRENKRNKQLNIMKSFRSRIKESLMIKSITPQQAMHLEHRFNNLTAIKVV